MALKRLPEPLHFKAGAKQCEQASDQNHAAPGHEAKLGTPFEFGNMSKDKDAEKRAAEYEAEATQKKKCVLQDRALISKRDRNEAHAAPERNLHQQENADHHEIGAVVRWKWLARIDGDLPELGQCLPDECNRTQYLEREQQQIDPGVAGFGVCVHGGDDIRSIGASLRLARDGFSPMEMSR
ncbi:MAG: hypothetical protein ACREEK_28455 [Bradyrhizobium sp.]